MKSMFGGFFVAFIAITVLGLGLGILFYNMDVEEASDTFLTIGIISLIFVIFFSVAIPIKRNSCKVKAAQIELFREEITALRSANRNMELIGSVKTIASYNDTIAKFNFQMEKWYRMKWVYGTKFKPIEPIR